MAYVDFNLLKSIVLQPHASQTKAKDSSVCLDQFLNMLQNLMSIGKNLSESEISLLTISLQQFLNHKARPNKYAYTGDINIGDIFNINCGLRYDPVLSYDHPALVMSKIEDLYFVVPSSTAQEKMNNAYNTENVNRSWYYYKVGQSDGFHENCALILGNALVVSRYAFLTKEGHVIQDINDPESTFQKIRILILENMLKMS